jgi:hypothetical protein
MDSRFRGNFLFTNDGVIVYNCYNCGFITKYDGGSHLSRNFESLMSWMNVSYEVIQGVKLDLLRRQMQGLDDIGEKPNVIINLDFKSVPLPEDAVPFDSMLMAEEMPDEFIQVLGYLGSRGEAVASGWNYHWSPSSKHDMRGRVIIPFYHHNNVVGWTARYAGKPPEGVPRYYNSDLQKGYIFNCDVINKPGRRFVTIHEGPFDAISVDGVAVLGSEMSREQIAWLNGTDKEKIVVPDRQKNNQGLIDTALENGWYVSFPEWEEDVKDAADATCRYGRLFTLQTVIESKTKSQLQIGIKRRMFRK